jgi:hypothetical protein
LQLAAGRQRDGQPDQAVIEQARIGKRGAWQRRPQARQARLTAPQHRLQRRGVPGCL